MSYKNNKIPTHIVGNSNILPQSKANQSMFNLSEDLKTTIDMDNLYPVYWEELNPGDNFEVKTRTLGRLMPMVTPTMSNINLKYFAFFVPNRLLWKNWNNFMGEVIYQGDHTEHQIPTFNEQCTPGSLADYMGVPIMTDKTKVLHFSTLPFRAYRKIWNEWFRANEIQEPEPIFDEGVSSEEWESCKLLKKGKKHDYFTSCLPYPQSGEKVMIPLTGDAPVLTARDGSPSYINVREQTTLEDYSTWLSSQGGQVLTNDVEDPHAHDTHLFADMSQVTGVSIEMLRKASALQVLLEKDARAGETYIDLMKVHYGTTVPDFLVGRSQFLGSSTTPINIEPIAQTGGTQQDSPQGNLAGVGIAANGQDLCKFSAVEHGVFMILACATADVSYSQGLHRKFTKKNRYDYMFPEFHNLGDQAVLNKEIFVTGTELDDEVFGYQERYRELREGTNKVTGLMRHDVPGSLDVWHLGQKFTNTPTLSGEFIQCNTPIDRVMAVPSEDKLILNTYFDIKARRTLPVSSNPSILAGRV